MRLIRLLFSLMISLTGALAAQAEESCPPRWNDFQPPQTNLQICFNIQNDLLQIEMSHPGRVWIALGFGAAMAGADAVVGRPETGEVLDMFINGYDAAAIVADVNQDITNHSVVFDGRRTKVKFSRALDTGDDADRQIVPGQSMPVIWAVGSGAEFSKHFAHGGVNIDWEGGISYVWDTALILHIVLMLAAWMLLMPLGVIIARYYKVLAKQDFPRELDNQFWWYWHLALQYGAIALAVIGFFAVWTPQKNIDELHSIAGIIALSLGIFQIASGLLRGSKGGPVDDDGNPNPPHKIRGDHYDMTRRRLIFEFLHKNGGYAAIAAGCVAAVSGLWRINAPWVALAALFVWLGFIAVYFFRLQKSGRWVGTYQAIWGPDMSHPGNRVSAAADKEALDSTHTRQYNNEMNEMRLHRAEERHR